MLFGPEPLTADSAISEAVRCAEIAFSQAAEQRDLERFVQSLDTDARFIGETVLNGPENIAAAWAPFFDSEGPAIRWRPQFVEVLENGQLALTRGPYRLETAAEDGSVTAHWGTFNSVWRRDDQGQWKVVFDAGSRPDEEPTDEMRRLLEADPDCGLDSSPQSSLPDPLAAGWEGQPVCEILGEDAHNRILRCTFPPGVGHERHYHAPYFGYAVSGGRVRMTDAQGTRELDLPTASSFTSEGVEWHEVLNIGETTIVYVIVEPRR